MSGSEEEADDLPDADSDDDLSDVEGKEIHEVRAPFPLRLQTFPTWWIFQRDVFHLNKSLLIGTLNEL